jgi:hypothetical protein
VQPSAHHCWDALCHLTGVRKEIVDIVHEELEYLMKFLILELDHLDRSHQPYNCWTVLDADRRNLSWRQDWTPSTLVSRCGQEERCKDTRRCITSILVRVHSSHVHSWTTFKSTTANVIERLQLSLMRR